MYYIFINKKKRIQILITVIYYLYQIIINNKKAATSLYPLILSIGFGRKINDQAYTLHPIQDLLINSKVKYGTD